MPFKMERFGATLQAMDQSGTASALVTQVKLVKKERPWGRNYINLILNTS